MGTSKNPSSTSGRFNSWTKAIKVLSLTLLMSMILPMVSCDKLDDLNKDPNNPVDVPSNYILTYVLTNLGKSYTSLGNYNSNLSGTLQYIQIGTTFDAARINYYDWKNDSWSGYYDLLRNVDIINKNAVSDANPFFEAISLTLRAFIFGTMTDLFGDCPYSESLQASSGVYFPKYDDQKSIYKGVLIDLSSANKLLSRSDISNYSIASGDLLYNGSSDKWRKFANSLRMRYCMRLLNKQTEMASLGVNIISEFNDAASYVFTSNSDNAKISYLGTTIANSFNGGPLNSANPPFSNKPCATIVDTLKSQKDPRLYRWLNPVLHKWDYNTTKVATKTVKNMFGDSFSVEYWPATLADKVDTSLYIGLPMGLPLNTTLNFNKGSDNTTYPTERSPFISYLHDRFRKNVETYIQMDLMSYSEVEFIFAEAAFRGTLSVTGTAEDHYKNGIVASMNRWGITDGVNSFSFSKYYSSPKVNYSAASNKLERIMLQKWISSWLGIEPWFDWRRTGYPDLKTGPVAQYGPELPLRFIYPQPNQDPKYLINYNAAVEKLEATMYVPTGQTKDHAYSKMWLLQGTNNPY
jgi:hypothetical protein